MMSDFIDRVILRSALLAIAITGFAWDVSLSPSTNWYDMWVPATSKDMFVHLPQIKYNTNDFFFSSNKIDVNFGYSQDDGPHLWPLKYPECGGSRQSPINMDPYSMTYLDVTEPILWQNYWTPAKIMTIANNGHTVILNGSWDRKSSPMLSGGILNGRYVFSQLHFHWGTDDAVGSEHVINNTTFPLEMHMVHYKIDYGSLEKALEYQNGLVVVSFLFQLSAEDNPILEYIVSSLPAIEGAQLKVELSRTFPIGALVTFTTDYLSYFGSLTTPPCSESVTWVVSTMSPLLSRYQLSKFRNLMSGHSGMDVNNFRPVQPHNSRPIYYISTKKSEE